MLKNPTEFGGDRLKIRKNLFGEKHLYLFLVNVFQDNTDQSEI